MRNVRFQNITCKGENGIFIRGSEDNYVEDVSFENIHLTLEKTSRWEIEGYDIRPCQGDGAIHTKISGIYADYARDISFEHVKINVEESMQPFYKEDVTLLNTEEITF